jgi:glyoxylase-like metal-dependent hydrolase (beta-lactamase superfamily II)
MLDLIAFLITAPLHPDLPEPEQADIAWVAEGEFCEPETVLPLPDDTLLVSNVCVTLPVGSGFLTLLGKAGEIIDWRIVDNLDAPLGMALHNGLLHIIDNNQVRTFRWPGYQRVATIALETKVANDIAIGPDDSIYITDTARGEVVVISPELEQSVLTGQPQFPGANGIHIDDDDLYVGGERLWHVDLRDNTVTTIGPEWLADIDGIEQEADGTFQITPVAGPLVRLDTEIEVLGGEGISSANHGYAPNLGLALIPTGYDNTVIAIRIEPGHPDETFPGYQWQPVRDGIYLHSAIDPLAAPVDGNSVIIDIGESVAVVDTHINPAVARTVIALIAANIGKPVTHVINTHWHDDHVNGNHAYREAWPDAKIISHQSTLESLRKEWQKMEDGRKTAYASVEAEQVYAAADELEDPFQAIGYRMYAGYIEALKPELPTMELVYPDTVFTETFVIDSGDRQVVVEWLGPGNTEGDIIVRLPEDDIVITGDLLVLPIPFAFDSPMIDWISTLETLRDIDAGTIIPGHGPVQYNTDAIDRLIALLADTLDAVRDAHDSYLPYSRLSEKVDLAGHEAKFTNGDARHVFAWRSYFRDPGLRSAWASLGYPVPEE